jgi:hypothetical protein
MVEASSIFGPGWQFNKEPPSGRAKKPGRSPFPRHAATIIKNNYQQP